LPVKLHFVTDEGPKKRAFPHIPSYIASDPNFRSLFLQTWFHETVPSEDPMRRWVQLNNTIHKAARAYFKFTEPKANAIAKTSALIKAIRGIGANHQLEEINDRLAKHDVGPIPDGDIIQQTDHCLEEMNNLYQKEGEVENISSKEEELGTATNFIKEAKLFLPSTRKRLRGIREKQSDQPTSDPEDMGRIIKNFWGGLWEKDETEQSCPEMNSYLRQTYPKRLDEELLLKPSIELVTNTILDTNNSSSGPDGIPFSIYRELVDVVSPCLLELTEHILEGGGTPAGFQPGTAPPHTEKGNDVSGRHEADHGEQRRKPDNCGHNSQMHHACVGRNA